MKTQYEIAQETYPLEPAVLKQEVAEVCSRIAPLWPLENVVAVNPWMGLSHQDFRTTAVEMNRIHGIPMTLEAGYYREKLESGEITPEDVQRILENSKSAKRDKSDFLSGLYSEEASAQGDPLIPTAGEVAASLTGTDWDRFRVHRISSWAAAYFDTGQAKWKAVADDRDIFMAWKKETATDRTPDLNGLPGFRAQADLLPDEPIQAIGMAMECMNIPDHIRKDYLHKLLLRSGGWSAHVARLDWDDRLSGTSGTRLTQWLAVLVSWEACLFLSLKHRGLEKAWRESLAAIHQDRKGWMTPELENRLVLQEAFDNAAQRKLVRRFQEQEPVSRETAVKNIQAIFCIDVRSEVFRRNLEMVDGNIETLGFAGFFAFPVQFMPLGEQQGEAQCPVLLKPGYTVGETLPGPGLNQQVALLRQLARQQRKLWSAFKQGAVTCFSFVSPLGLSYLFKLVTDTFGWTRVVKHPSRVGIPNKWEKHREISLSREEQDGMIAGISLIEQVSLAQNALKAMSMTGGFGKWVLIVGHGSTSVNNPHATGLDCGACGGHTGEANAKVAAAVLNNREVRSALKERGIDIPEETVFLAAMHDTTTDEVTIFNENKVPQEKITELEQIKRSLQQAGRASRAERAQRMDIEKGRDTDSAVIERSRDWSQIRPEWGLAGCSAFIVAPRERTRGMNLGGRSFLHSYQWKQDEDFKVLELIMTAPMVVASWISLQYYASVVAPQHFGAGNKTLHNITSGLGVLEGFSGDLRTGLPWQSVHNGDRYQHEPLRLQVVIEAPVEAMNRVLEKHQQVRDLCDNGWLFLLHMNEQGRVTHRYAGNLDWQEI